MDLKTINGRKTILKYEEGGLTTALSDAIRKEISLAGANLIGANLIGANLKEANLEGAKLKNAFLEGANLEGANLEGADLRGANLRGANLKEANLEGANLRNADLRGTFLRWANLTGANLSGVTLESAFLQRANLSCANLEGTDLQRANLACANINEANLTGANLFGANLERVKLNGAKNIPYIPLSCPSEGAFIGWKKVNNEYLVKIQIPEDARRLSATSRKCRCDMAKVLDITSLDGEEHYDEVVNYNYTTTVYKVGEKVYPDSFDENRWNECSHEIHFFINKDDAINY